MKEKYSVSWEIEKGKEFQKCTSLSSANLSEDLQEWELNFLSGEIGWKSDRRIFSAIYLVN